MALIVDYEKKKEFANKGISEMGNIGLKALQIKFSGNRHTIIGMIDLKGIFEFMCKTKLDGDIHIHTLAEKEYFH